MNDYYLARVARSVFVPEMWLEDAIQEAKIAIWLAPHAPPKTVARRACIGFARKFGLYRRNGTSRETSEIPPTYRTPDATPLVDRLFDFTTAWQKLRPAQRQVLMERATGRSELSSEHRFRVSRARRRLRELVA